jgi:hypothetical protein
MADSIDPNKEQLERIAEATERVADYYRDHNNLRGDSASEKIVNENAALMSRMDQLITALEGSDLISGGKQAQRSDALRKARESSFNLRPPEQQGMGAQYAYGVQRNLRTGLFETATGFLNPRRAVGNMSLPGVAEALKQGHLEQAAGMFTTGVARNPYVQPFLLGSELRGAATGIGYARDRVIGQRLGQQTQMGMAAGYQGPGNQGWASGGGSFLASLGAMPSMMLGMGPNAFGKLFGANMSPAASVGYRSQFEALKSTISDPFGMLGYKDYQNINQAVGSKGYSNYGQMMEMTNAVIGLTKTTGMTEGVGLGAAVDTLDLAVKRLHMDVNDAADMMKNYGAIARGAGKDVATFSQETSAVLQSMSAQNAVGPGALGASALMSSIPQVTGQAVFGMLNSSVNNALTMSSMAGQGAPTNMLATMALGGGYGAGGGVQEYAMMGQQITAFRGMVDQIIQSSGGDQQLGYTIASKIYNMPPLAIKQLYEHGEKVVKQANVLGKMDQMKGDVQFKYGSKYGIRKAVGTGAKPALGEEASQAHNELIESAKGKGPAHGGMTGDQQQLGNVTLSSPNLKETSTDIKDAFNNYTKQVARAYLNLKGQERTDDLWRIKSELEEGYAGVLEYDEVLNAGMLLAKASKGGKAGDSAFAKLSTQYGLKVGTKFDSDTFKSDAKNLEALKATGDIGKGSKYQTQALDLIHEAEQAGFIKKGEAKWYEKQVEGETGRFNLDKFRSKILGKAGKQQDASQQHVTLELSALGKKLVGFVDPKKGSLQGNYMIPIIPGAPPNQQPTP